MRSLRHILLLIGMTLVYSVYGQGYGDNGVCINYISNEGCIIHREGQDVSSLAIAQGLSTIRDDDLVLKTCVQDFTKFVCASVFPRCNNSSPVVEIIPSCQSTCENARNSCAINSKGALEETQGIIEKYVLSSPLFPQDCTGHPTNGCNNSPQLSDRPKCFEPLVEDRIWVNTNKNEVTDRNFCLKGCCLPCPQSYAFYPSNKMKKGFIATQILRALSAVGSGILLVSYLTLPGKRTHPNSLILFASLSIFLYSSNVYFSIVKPETVQCVSEVIPSTQENNPLFCGIQGALLVFSSQATAIWIGIIILNLHIHTVWNSNIIGEKYLYLHIVGWGIPAILTAVALGTKSINYQFATLCLIDVSKSNEIFFYPLAFIVLPSFFVHMATFFYIYKISRKDESKESNSSSEFMTYRRHVLQVVKIQWRALLLSVLLLVTVIFYWLFYFIELNTIATDTRSLDFIKNWLICIQSGRGQDYCSNLVNMPPYDLLITAEVLTSLIGIYSIIIFFNKTLWLEWGQWIREHFGSSCRGREVGEVYPI